MKTFEELNAWQACRDLRIWVKSTVKSWPDTEKFDLRDQSIRAARSACANIAEGYGRYNSKDNARFCKMALGSLFELLNHLIDAEESGYISQDELQKGRTSIESAVKLLRGYRKYLLSSNSLEEPSVIYGNELTDT